ncbi:hypothetical protein BZA77DRAFT_93119 [Pyronema omphalodes]|nr:hypothetical protein BZA77DRAFT_93119 [Pyronema omphalodes]
MSKLRLFFLIITSTFLFLAFFYQSSVSTASMTSVIKPSLDISFHQVSKPGETPLKIKVVVRNPTSSTFTIFNWNSPLDSLAANVGVFRIFDGDNEVEGAVIRINRVLPAGQDALTEIPAGGEAEVVHVLRPFNLEKGKYRVESKWNWMKLWESAKEDVTAEMMEGASGFGGSDGEQIERVVEVEV